MNLLDCRTCRNLFLHLLLSDTSFFSFSFIFCCFYPALPQSSFAFHNNFVTCNRLQKCFRLIYPNKLIRCSSIKSLKLFIFPSLTLRLSLNLSLFFSIFLPLYLSLPTNFKCTISFSLSFCPFPFSIFPISPHACILSHSLSIYLSFVDSHFLYNFTLFFSLSRSYSNKHTNTRFYYFHFYFILLSFSLVIIFPIFFSYSIVAILQISQSLVR